MRWCDGVMGEEGRRGRGRGHDIVCREKGDMHTVAAHTQSGNFTYD